MEDELKTNRRFRGKVPTEKELRTKGIVIAIFVMMLLIFIDLIHAMITGRVNYVILCTLWIIGAILWVYIGKKKGYI